MTTPVMIAMAAAGLFLLYVAFKATKFILKVFFILVALAALAAAACWIYSANVH